MRRRKAPSCGDNVKSTFRFGILPPEDSSAIVYGDSVVKLNSTNRKRAKRINTYRY